MTSIRRLDPERRPARLQEKPTIPIRHPRRSGRRLARGIVFLWFAIGGIAHFVLTPLFVRIVPPALPWPEALVAVSGLFELIGAAGLLLPRWRRAAGIGLFVLTICVTPANVYMWQRADLFPQFPPWTLAARLPIQAVLLWAIWFAAIARRDGAGRA